MPKIHLRQVLELLPALKETSGGAFVGECPNCGGASGSTRFNVRESEDGGVLAHCFVCESGGWRWIEDRLKNGQEAAARKPLRVVRANLVTWQKAASVTGTAAEVYLRRRGVTVDIPDTVRWAPGRQGGRVLFGYAEPGKPIQGYSAERLEPDGTMPSRRERKSHGTKVHRRFVAQEGEDGAATLIAAEGEVSALVVAAQHPGCEVVATGGASGMKRLHEWVDGGRTVVLEADGDSAGYEAARTAFWRLKEKGCQVSMRRREDGADPADGPGEEHEPEPPQRTRFEELEERFRLILEHGGRCVVLDSRSGRWRVRREFQAAYNDEFVEVGDKAVPLGSFWLMNTRHRFEEMVCSPSGELPSGAYNTWPGFAVQPRRDAGSYERFEEHIFENICSGNIEHHTYLMKWLCRLFQNPGEPGEVAVVLQGARGVGKTVLGEVLSRMIGENHSLLMTRHDELSGEFTEHLESQVFVFLDESYNPRIRQHQSILQSLITSPRLLVHPKGLQRRKTKNFAHVIIAANSRSVVAAGQDERRFFCLSVGRGRQQDTAFFGSMMRELEDGGYQALMSYFMSADISAFEPRHVPKTASLQVQQEESLAPVARWWLCRLSDGELPAGEDWECAKSVPCRTLFSDFAAFSPSANLKSDEMTLAAFLKDTLPGIQRTRRTTGGASGAVTRRWYWDFPGLEDARTAWEHHYGPRDWEDEAPEMAGPS